MFHVLSFHKNLNRVLLSSVFFYILILSFITFSHAASVSNFGQWKNLNSFSKTAYTAGLIDTYLTHFGESTDKKMFSANLGKCLNELQITIIEVVEMINNFYQNKENWALTPQNAVNFQLINGHCFQYLN